MVDWGMAQIRLKIPGAGAATALTYAALFAAAAGHASPATDVRGQWAAEHFPKYEQDASAARIAEYIAQTCNETGGFTRFEENLNYTPQVLLSQWGSHFTPAQAQVCGRTADHPADKVQIASRAYGGRMGNAPYPSTDGYKYRGRWDLQTTGKANYDLYGRLIGADLVTNPDGVPGDMSMLTALEFFRHMNVNAAIDAADFVKARRITNGGSIGLDNVAAIRGKLLAILQ